MVSNIKPSLWRLRTLLALLLVVLLLPLLPLSTAHAQEGGTAKNLVYDEAQLLSAQEIADLNALANKLGAKRKTDFIIYTTRNEAGTDVVKLTQDFYDNKAPGYDKAHGNAAILTLDMKNREIYLAGFYKGKEYLEDARLDKIRNKITPDLTAGSYYGAFKTYINTAYRYMGISPSANPDNPLFNNWIQLAIAAALGVGIVGMMAYQSGGRVTVNSQTYEVSSASGIIDKQDQYIRTTVTRRKIEKNNGGGGGGGGGGGTTGGGHSHSGSRGSF